MDPKPPVPTYAIRIDGGSRPFTCGRDETVLYAMRMADVRDIEFKCRAGGCGTCRTQVLEGTYAVGAMSDEQVEPEELARHVILACQLYPRSDLLVRPYRRMIEGMEKPPLGSSAVSEGRYRAAVRDDDF